jgi:hypothetical protein
VAPEPEQLRDLFARILDPEAPIDALRAGREARDLMTAWDSHLARQALAGGATWEGIGAALGISRQAAWERLRPGIAREIEEERSRIQSEQSRLKEERRKKWPTTKS